MRHLEFASQILDVRHAPYIYFEKESAASKLALTLFLVNAWLIYRAR